VWDGRETSERIIDILLDEKKIMLEDILIISTVSAKGAAANQIEQWLLKVKSK